MRYDEEIETTRCMMLPGQVSSLRKTLNGRRFCWNGREILIRVVLCDQTLLKQHPKGSLFKLIYEPRPGNQSDFRYDRQWRWFESSISHKTITSFILEEAKLSRIHCGILDKFCGRKVPSLTIFTGPLIPSHSLR